MEDVGDEFNAAVAAELRAKRGRTKMTIDTIVRATGLSKSAVLNYLNAKRDIPMPAFHALASALGVSPSAVMELADRAVMELADRAVAASDDFALAASDDPDWQERQEWEAELP